MTAPTAHPRPTLRSPSFIWLTAFAVVVLAILAGLGVWQLQRLQWKQALIDRIEARVEAPPLELSQALAQAAAGADIEFRLVEGEAVRLPGQTLRLFWTRGGRPGWRLIAPFRLADGTAMLVDRGFVTNEDYPAVTPLQGTQALRGRLRGPDRPTAFTPDNRPQTNEWYWRDDAAMARALGLDPADLSPWLLSLENAGGDPGPLISAALPEQIPNRHLGYAITWFGLAACLVGVYLALVWKLRRQTA
jgi:surfeit locus 1 family protein